MSDFGDSFLSLLKEVGMTPKEYADKTGRPPSTLYRWINLRDREPRIPAEFFHEVSQTTGIPEAQVFDRLGGREKEVDVVREPGGRFSSDERYGQPLTDRTIVIQCIGRLEHYYQRIQEIGKEYSARIDEITRLADEEIVKARKALLAKIDHDDKGRKV